MCLASPPPRTFVLDFDGTIITQDTIGLLGGFGVEWQATRGVDMKGDWDNVVRAYRSDFEDHVEDYKPAKDDRRTLNQEIQYYRALREIEERSFRRVSQSGLFRGITPADWEGAGRDATEKGDVILRKGFKEFLGKLEQAKSPWGIVSVNFSGSFIRGVIGASAGPRNAKVEVLANELDEKGIVVGPRGISGRVIATSDAKLASMKDLLKSWGDRTSLNTSRVVYIGDSETDIECLLEPGVVGIIMSEDGQSSLMQTMRRTGVHVFHVRAYERDEPSGKSIYWARDFDEIHQSPLFMEVAS